MSTEQNSLFPTNYGSARKLNAQSYHKVTTQLAAKVTFPWQEKLVVPLIATPNGDMQCEDRVTKKDRATASIDSFKVSC